MLDERIVVLDDGTSECQGRRCVDFTARSVCQSSHVALSTRRLASTLSIDVSLCKTLHGRNLHLFLQQGPVVTMIDRHAAIRVSHTRESLGDVAEEDLDGVLFCSHRGCKSCVSRTESLCSFRSNVHVLSISDPPHLSSRRISMNRLIGGEVAATVQHKHGTEHGTFLLSGS